MKTKIPRRLLGNARRREMWKHAQRILKKIERTIPVRSARMIGSFTTKKKRPADVDVILMLRVGEKDAKKEWSLDLVIMPDNAYGAVMAKDAEQWMKQKYGSKGFEIVELK